MFGILVGGELIIAPRTIIDGEWAHDNPTPEQYLAAGYLPVVFTDPPEAPEGYYPISEWEEQDGEIRQVWHFEELPPDELSPEDALARYINEQTGANDPDLVSATERLITKFTEE